jgi:aryl sulfotransferase
MSGLYWLASYPKSGNTWLRLLLQSYLAGGAAVDINAIAMGAGLSDQRAQFDEAIGVAASDLTHAEILAWQGLGLRAWLQKFNQAVYVKTHGVYTPTSLCGSPSVAEVTLGAIYLLRDPRDVALSLARHIDQGVDVAITLMGTPDKTMNRSRSYLKPRLPETWGSWSQNVEGWLAPRALPVHVVRYEALRAAPQAALLGILTALQLPIDLDAIQAAIAATDLAGLRAQEAAKGFTEGFGAQAFFGEGRVQGWCDRLTPPQVARIEADHGPMMARFGYL